MWEGGRAAMSCFVHMVAPNRKQKAPDVSSKPQAPGPELSSQLPSQGGGPSPPEQGASPAAVVWLTHEDMGPAVMAPPPLFLQAASLSVAGTSWWSWCATLSWASSLPWSFFPW